MRILLAGATGYLGNFILQELLEQNTSTRIIVRNKKKLSASILARVDVLEADLTNPATIKNCCNDIDVVISTVGITKQKEGFTYMDVDYQANLNLLEEAQRNGVKKFIYISVFNGDKMTQLKICQAKEKFAAALKNSGLEYCIVRPTGYFSDMAEFYTMAKKGTVFLFGDGQHKMNPIHGADLAKVCVSAVLSNDKAIPIGGPQVLTYNEIASIAFSVAHKKPKLIHIPEWFTKGVLWMLRRFTGSRFYGPIEFFITVLSTDLVAPAYGSNSLEEYFKTL